LSITTSTATPWYETFSGSRHAAEDVFGRVGVVGVASGVEAVSVEVPPPQAVINTMQPANRVNKRRFKLVLLWRLNCA